ncbi:MAG: GT4 family glycosyltransferase PelF [Candidatus Margulisiibacteriota bacterium]
MKVAILVEGSYPYVFGGVSSWLDGLIRALPRIEFQIVSIMPSRKEASQVNYPFPPNVTGLFPIYLQSFQELNPLPSPREPRLTPEQIQAISEFIRFDKKVNWQIIIQTICNQAIVGNTVEFLYTKIFWTLLTEYYQEFFPEEPFNEFFWTIRSMFVFFINIMQSELPEADIYHSVSTGYAGLLGVIATHRNQKPFLLTEHGIYAREREEDILKATWVKDTYKKLWIDFFYFISEAAYHCATRTVSLFDRNREIQVSYGAKAEHALVIPNGIDPQVYQPKK